MNSVKILHCGDIHIGAAVSGLGTLAATRRFETLITFEKILKLAKENSVDILLIAGDLLDSNNIEDSFIDRIFEGFKSIPEIKIVFAGGNHDPINLNSPFTKREKPDNLYILSTDDDCIYFKDLNTKVYGRSFSEVYMSGKESFFFKADPNTINIMCQHGELKSDLNSEYNAIIPSFIENSGMDYIALGHIHKRTEILRLQNTDFGYCGCAEGQGFDELLQKGVYIGTVTKGKADLDFVPTSKRMYILEKIDISSLETNLEILNKISETLRNNYGENYTENLYKIVLTGEISEETDLNVPEILSRISSDVYFIKIKDQTVPKVNLDLLKEEKNLMGVFVKKMTEMIEKSENDEKIRLENALNIGLKAFSKEVYFNED